MTGLKLWQRTSAVLLAAAMLIVGGTALAITAPDGYDDLDIKLPDYRFITHDGYDRDMGSLQATLALENRYGGKWAVYSWNSLSGTPRHVYGTSVQVSGDITSAAQLEDVARRVIADNAEVLKTDGSDLRLHATPNGMGKWVAHFQQTYSGLDVWEAKVRVAFSDTGKLMLMGSDFFDNITVDPNPSIGAMAAQDISLADLPFDASTDRIEADPVLLVLPVAISETEVEHHLVWRTRIRTQDPLGIWVTHVDAHSGEIIWRYNDIHFAYSGDTEIAAQIYGYCDGVTESNIPYMDINVSGVGTVVSDENGEWYIVGSGGARTVTAAMDGPYVTVNNYNGAEASFSGTAFEDTPFTVRFDDSNARHDERDTFDAVNDIKDFFDQFDATFGYSNAHINAYVNRTDGYCPGNAWWDGTINFCAAGGSYGNTGEMQQVVHHEFGHGVQAHILGGQGNEGLGEGNSDILGNLITQDNIIGRGFYTGNCVTGIRDSDNNLQYPADLNGSVHHDGQIIAGFNWDAMILLQDMYDVGSSAWNTEGTIKSAERWHFGRVLGHPYYQDDQVFWTFVADDDNGDLADGTPHHAIFAEAAENHGYVYPEVQIGVFVNHEAHPYTGNFVGSYECVGTAVSLPLGDTEIDAGSVTLSYRVNGGGFNTISMTATGNPDEYSASIPAQSDGSVVEYYLYAENTELEPQSGTSPDGAPANLHYFQVNDVFPDEMEFDTAWHIGELTEETASTGTWERADPEPTDVQPGDDHTPAPGTDCWVTGPLAGTSVGAYDVDGGQTVLYSPRFDLVGATDVSISYWRFYSNDGGNAPGQDFWVVEISNDGGDTWTDVENSNASPNAWEQIAFDLDTYFATPGVVQMRFVASDLGDGSIVEALVDDFLLTGLFDPTGVDDGVSVAFNTSLGQNHPNPFNPKTEIRFSLAQAGAASLKIYDAQGRLVKVLVDGVVQAGEREVVWNGDDANGRPVASGMYFYKLQTEEQNISKRMVLLK